MEHFAHLRCVCPSFSFTSSAGSSCPQFAIRGYAFRMQLGIIHRFHEVTNSSLGSLKGFILPDLHVRQQKPPFYPSTEQLAIEVLGGVDPLKGRVFILEKIILCQRATLRQQHQEVWVFPIPHPRLRLPQIPCEHLFSLLQVWFQASSSYPASHGLTLLADQVRS